MTEVRVKASNSYPILIDGDLRKPDIKKYFDFPDRKKTIASVLKKESRVSEAAV